MKALLLAAAFLFILSCPLSADSSAQPETPAQKANRERVERKLESIVLEKFNFDSADMKLDMVYLTKKSKELDPEHIGIKFSVLSPPRPASPHVHRELSSPADISLSEIVRCICAEAKLGYRIEGNSVVFFQPPVTPVK